jgi:G3E family GTPase
MSNPMSRRTTAGLAVTLVSGTSPQECARVCEILTGLRDPHVPQVLDFPGHDDAEFAADLATNLVNEFQDGSRGNTVILLEESADVVEIALVLEHVLDTHQPREAIAVREVVAVSGVAEILSVLFVAGEQNRLSEKETDFATPGRLARRLEFASLIVLTDVTDVFAPFETELVKAFLARVAPAARVLAMHEVMPAWHRPGMLARGRAHRLGASMGWQRELFEGTPARGSHEPIGTFVFRDPRPFHPQRLHRALSQQLVPERVGRIIRSRGFVRLASRPATVGSWATAGDVLDLDATTMLSWHPDSPIGQEIVFFGLDLDTEAVQASLAGCLLTDAELTAGPPAWMLYSDPFPQWATHRH